MSIHMNPEFITQLQPPVLPVSLEKTEPLAVIKNEPPEPEIVGITIDDVPDSSDEETIPDIKDVDIIYHTLCEDLIISETVPTNILESKYSVSVKTQVFMKTENTPFVKVENIIESENFNETEGSCNGNGQKAVEGQGNLETDAQHVVNFSNVLNGISVRSPKPEHPKKIDFADPGTRETTSSQEIKEKIKVIKAPIIPAKSHEYITLAKNNHICNHCQLKFKTLNTVKYHIRIKHREVTTMYQCLYCSFKSKWKQSVRFHIICKHKGTKNNLKYYYCDKCDYNTYHSGDFKRHKIIHLKPEEIQYFYCHQCSYKCKYNQKLKYHVLRHLENVENEQNLKRYCCDKCTFETSRLHSLKRHKLNHLKPEEILYFYCYHCSFKSKYKCDLKTHILRHFKREEIKFDCYICDFMTLKRDRIIKHLEKHFKHCTKSDEAKCKYPLENHTEIRYDYCDKCDFKTYHSGLLRRHKLNHLKPEEIQYFYCYYCSFKFKHKSSLKTHIFRHFKKEEIKFHCYICDFMTFKRELIIYHIKKKHSKVQIKSEINEGN